MFDNISSWLDVFCTLHRHAIGACGAIEVTTDDIDSVRWPRTSGADVIAIAAVLDPYVRALPARFGAHTIGRRWGAVIEDLARHALVDPHAEYAENRAFWRSLPAVCVYLNDEDSPMPPPDVWNALAAAIADGEDLRNVGPKGDGPFQHFDNVKTFDDLYFAQYKHLRDTRGADELAPERGMGGAKYAIPRTTNADVVALADYWSKQLADTKEVFGHKGVVERWKKARADVDALARKGDPSAVYPKNNAFWRDLRNTVIHVAAADEMPSKWDLAKDALRDSVKNLPANVRSGVEAATTAIGAAASEVAQGVGKIANDAGKGLFAGFGTPLLVGAGLLGIFLISRNRASAESP